MDMKKGSSARANEHDSLAKDILSFDPKVS